MQVYELYTDGSAKGKWGAWAFVLLQNGKVVKEVSARVRETNSNRMEFQAAIEALQALPADSEVTLFTDCRILIENVSLFSVWKEQNWLKKNRAKIPNVDQFQILDQLLQSRNVKWQWVRAHSGNPFNDRCDALCILSRDQRSEA